MIDVRQLIIGWHHLCPVCSLQTSCGCASSSSPRSLELQPPCRDSGCSRRLRRVLGDVSVTYGLQVQRNRYGIDHLTGQILATAPRRWCIEDRVAFHWRPTTYLGYIDRSGALDQIVAKRSRWRWLDLDLRAGRGSTGWREGAGGGVVRENKTNKMPRSASGIRKDFEESGKDRLLCRQRSRCLQRAVGRRETGTHPNKTAARLRSEG